MKHTKAWFINRVGKWICRDNQIFTVIKETRYQINGSIKVASKSHAIALYITQSEKGTRYYDPE